MRAPARGGPAIEARGLIKEYRAGEPVVDGLDLHVRAGTVYCLLGRNGAGKTTTIRMLTTLTPRSGGEATVAGAHVDDVRAVRARIGVALQEVALDPAMSPREHLDLALRLHGAGRRSRRERRDVLVERFGLASFAGRPVSKLSGGMRRRTDIALAVVDEPQVLFLDEPSAGLDIDGRDEVWDVIRSLRREGRSVMLTTHDLDEAVALADVVGIMRGGRIAVEGEPAALAARAGRTELILSGLPAALARSLVDALEAAGYTAGWHDDEVRCPLGRASVSEVASIVNWIGRAGGHEVKVRTAGQGLREVFMEVTA